MKLLLAEDTQDLNRAITAMLEMQNYTVDSTYDGEEALEYIMKNGYDAIVLDIMMPKKDGLEVLKEIREKNIVTPVLMLTAKAEVEDRVAGLNLGADDYLTKPFAMQELIARVNAMTRRGARYDAKNYEIGNIKFSAETQELTAENSVRLSSKESDTLEALLVNRSEAVEMNYLLEHVWKDTPDADEEMASLYIKYLKDKLSYINSNVRISGDKGGPYRVTVEENL